MALQIESVASNFLSGGALSTITVVKPAGTVKDDLLFAIGGNNNGFVTGITLPAGYTKIRDYDHTAGGPGGGLGFKIAGASEPVDYTFDCHCWAKHNKMKYKIP